MEANDGPHQRGLLQAHLGHFLLPQLLEPAGRKQSRSKAWTRGAPSRLHRGPDLAAFTSAPSRGEIFRLSRSSLFLKMAHIMGVIQAKVVKDRNPALSTGWDLWGTGPVKRRRTREEEEEKTVQTPTVGRRSGRVLASGGSGGTFCGEAPSFHCRPDEDVGQQIPPTAISSGSWLSSEGLAQTPSG